MWKRPKYLRNLRQSALIFQNEKLFFQFFVAFMESPSNFEYFERKDDRNSKCNSETTERENIC